MTPEEEDELRLEQNRRIEAARWTASASYRSVAYNVRPTPTTLPNYYNRQAIENTSIVQFIPVSEYANFSNMAELNFDEWKGMNTRSTPNSSVTNNNIIAKTAAVEPVGRRFNVDNKEVNNQQLTLFGEDQ